MDSKNMRKSQHSKRGYYSEIVTGTIQHPVTPKLDFLPTAPRRTKLAWQVYTEQHSAVVRDLKLQKTYNFLGEAKRWMTFAEDRSIVFPAETFAPKVQMDQNVEAKKLPRNVEMERRRRMYQNVKIENVLKTEGISLHDILPPKAISMSLPDDKQYDLFDGTNFLPLEIFDDESYDCRTTEDWINLGVIDGVRYPLPATAFVNKYEGEKRKWDHSDSHFVWCHVAVTDYDSGNKLWTVLTLNGDKRKYLLPRIYIRFFAEDPTIFAKRVRAALEHRQYAQSSIKYNLYLDCMPMDGIPVLQESIMESIIALSLRHGTLKFKTDKVSAVVEEVLLDYQRTMCDLMWRRLIDTRPEMFKFLTWKPLEEIMKVSETGRIHTGMENFKERKDYLHWSILYVLPEVYEAMSCIVAECIRVSNMNLFLPNYGKSMNLSHFEAEQTQMTMTILKYLREPWLEKVTQSVRMCLRDVGKGWFNLEQKFHEVYDIMKLKRFMDLTVLRMQIRQVHPFLLPSLKFPPDLYLSSVGLMEEHVCETRYRLQMAYQKSIIPLKAYAKEYEKYLGLFKLHVAKYVEEFQNENHTAMEVKDEIAFHVDMRRALELALPSKITIGPFVVNVKPLKEILIQKRQDCITRLLIMFAENLRNEVQKILFEYTQIKTKLREVPQSIEEVFQLREWIETIPLTVQNLNDTMQGTKQEFDILEYFSWNISDEDFQAMWEALSSPRQIQIQVEEAMDRFVEEQDKFYKVQIQDEILLSEKIDTLVGNVANIAMQTDIEAVHETAIEVKRIWKMMNDCREQGLLLNERQKLFDMPIVPFEHLNRFIKEFESYKSLWVTASDWLRWYEIWMENPLISIDGNQIDDLVAEMHKVMSRCVKTFQEFPKVAAIALTIRNQIETFKPHASMIQALRNPGMKARHFDELSAQTGIQMTLTPSLTFKNLVVLGIMQFEDAIKTVAEAAAKEYSIEGTLNKMISEWETITMDVLPYKNTGTYIMKISDEVTMLLDDHILSVQQLAFSPFKAAFEEKIVEWDYKLKLTQEVILLWVEVQKQWMYLEPIFTSEDISRQLPVETRKYNTMERNWKRIMKNAYECPFVIRICPDKSLLESLKECLSLLELVQKGLSDYLETKRIIFPRFYFLSDDELLEIVAQSRNVRAVQPHLKKCFENMMELRFENDLKITRMYSAEYEQVILRPAIYPEGNVENWLGQVELAMRNTLREIIGEALEAVEITPRKEWVYMWPGQVTLCGGQTYWTAHVEKSITNNTLANFYHIMLSHLDDLRDLIRGQQTEIQRLMLEAVITIEVHARDVLQRLIQEEVVNVNDFDWISQLRYYWVNDKDLKVRAVNAEFSYGYEYLGNNGRLVITPLTDRCYLTLTGALHLKFGGAPAGPAGTGKTETTKDLAKAFAIQCVVFNCSDQLDYMSMGKFFKGLASAGAWACFDEFNRIDIEVLSVIAQQIITIQKAQQIRADVFLFEGVELTLKPSCAVFITMNPGYAGRTELPDNLKALFRPVAMMVPNYALIAEISLFSYGFADAKKLAGKITTTFKLSSEQLSTQDHYDFGMRAVKTVITVAGNLKREQKDLDEQQICLRALRDVNVPKFLKDDLKLFNGIVSDLFPRLIEKPVDYGMLETAICKCIDRMGLEGVQEFVKKVIQLYETTVVRHGLMLVGPTGSGKTKVISASNEKSL
ncbi:hypothetical protein KM043_016158 [Ampulex compressa]|nr:hypothetical protein KM043_016158 [Ampulex compressa]